LTLEAPLFWRFRLNPQGVFEGAIAASGFVAIEALAGCIINLDQVFSHENSGLTIMWS
jgi:hypothetical protein